MLQGDATENVAFLGVQLQLAGSLLCLGLGLSLRRGAGQRPWFGYWVAGFGAFAVAVAALFAWHLLGARAPAAALGGLHALFFAGKLAFLACLFLGSWHFAREGPPPGWVTRTALLFLPLGSFLLVALLPVELPALVRWQALLAVPVFGASSALLLGTPAGRATRGSRFLAWVFVAFASLWLLYVPAFGIAEAGPAGPLERGLRALGARNWYVDVLLLFFLAVGMVLALLDDLFREREAERAARLREVGASEARLAQIIRSASEGIVLLDGDRRIVHLNPAALEILDVGAREVEGVPFDRFLPPEDRAALWGGLVAVTPRSEALPAIAARREVTGRRAGGEAFPLEVAIASLGEGPASGYVLILRDRTEAVRRREEWEQMQAQLAQAARMETIGRMVSGVAHELNNPLTAILAFAQDLESEARTPADAEALTTIVQQAQRCRAIVLDLLNFARNPRQDREPVTPLELAERVRPAIEREAQAQGTAFTVAIPADLPALEASPAALEQVLTNLLGNALQAVDGPGEVRLTAAVAGQRIEFVVEDDGPGIPPQAAGRIFEPFFTTKSAGKGTGLGLSVSLAIAQQHGGTLRAEGRPDGKRGARFVLALPFVERRAVPRPSLPPAPPAAEARPRRVLVVDDESPIRIAVRRYLERRGWVVEEAADGAEALAILGIGREGPAGPAAPFDAIVTDLKMPDISGIALHDRIAQAAPALLERLVVISGDTASGEIAEFLARLRRPLVLKPFELRTLADLLDRVAAPAAAVEP